MSQVDLFPATRTRVIQLADDSWARLIQVLDARDAMSWMEELILEVPLEERSIVLFGKRVLQPRLVGWAGDQPYTYSGQTLEPRPMGRSTLRLLELTEGQSGYSFNHALFNLYRDGSDGMGMHSDDEPELGERPVIASWSFGEERIFAFAEKGGGARHRVVLPSGSLLLMEGNTQRRFRHGVPKVKAHLARRLNVTLRWVDPGAPSHGA